MVDGETGTKSEQGGNTVPDEGYLKAVTDALDETALDKVIGWTRKRFRLLRRSGVPFPVDAEEAYIRDVLPNRLDEWELDRLVDGHRRADLMGSSA